MEDLRTFKGPQATKTPPWLKIPLSGNSGAGKFLLVDIEDYTRLAPYRWGWNSSDKRAYTSIRKKDGDGNPKKTMIAANRFVLGVTDPLLWVIFINGNSLDIRKSNLRVVSKGAPRTNVFVPAKPIHENRLLLPRVMPESPAPPPAVFKKPVPGPIPGVVYYKSWELLSNEIRGVLEAGYKVRHIPDPEGRYILVELWK